ncbi:DUF695 domain-containing protein [Nocardiopsis sp. N85]|uniref:DUF695 domain-containing protein n=1 Tax=Nocardiopsis sp. N85 TaxID=3029400 RepID=UPI00237F1A77|nr:DUF695 domain-containing protein [Nocardiopsis sp. N85]MDE3721676.1 DUF695 domain-containing protein [Nocardiopsis sp. N85]
MALFRRRRSNDTTDSTAAISAFWDAWPTLREPLAEAVEADRPAPDEVAERVTALVKAVHPDLDWEAGPAPSTPEPGLEDLDLSMDVDPDELLERLAALDDPAAFGQGPAHALTLRPGPSDDARIQSERWTRSAPDDDAWAFLPARPADHESLTGTVRWDDHELDLTHVSVSMRVDHATGRIEVGVYHPDNMFLSEDVRRALADHVVLLALGEDESVRRIGTVVPLEESPLDPLPPTSIPAAVRQMIDMLGGGNDGWVTLKATNLRQDQLVLSARHPVTRRDFPAFTLAVQVLVPYTDKGSDGQPDGASAVALQELESRLARLLDDNGALFLRSTLSGRRDLMYYLDPESDALAPFEEELKSWSEGDLKLSSRLDPDRAVFAAALRPYRRFLQG